MEDISRDLHDPHWWFNIIVGVLLVVITYIITEFGIKPLGTITKKYLRGSGEIDNGNNSVDDETVTRIQEDQREEMRMNFRLIHIKQAIYFKIATLVILIPGVILPLFVVEFWPVKFAIAGFGTWTIYPIIRDVPKLIRFQNYYLNILSKVQKS